MKNYKNYLCVGLGFLIAVFVMSFTDVGTEVTAQIQQKVLVINDKSLPVPISGTITNDKDSPVAVLMTPFEKNKIYLLNGGSELQCRCKVYEVKGNWIRATTIDGNQQEQNERWINTSFIQKIDIPKIETPK